MRLSDLDHTDQLLGQGAAIERRLLAKNLKAIVEAEPAETVQEVAVLVRVAERLEQNLPVTRYAFAAWKKGKG